jgi:NAD(P)H-hydrate epimerase
MPATAVPAVTVAQMQEIDRLMAAVYPTEPPALLENTGRALALLARRLLDEAVADRAIVVLAGPGSNGAGGLAAARLLLEEDAWVQIILTDAADALGPAAAEQFAALQAAGAPIAWAEDGWELPPADLVIDAILDAGDAGEPQGAARALIQLANSSPAPILSLDAPSGVDGTTGRGRTPHVRAAATLARGLPLAGLLQPAAHAACGRLFLADAGVPRTLYAQVGIDAPLLFAREPILELQVRDGRAYVEAGTPAHGQE